MSDWSAGYVAEIDYTHGFYRELSPSLLSFAALAQGVRAPSIDQPLNYCELGCGQGLSMNILAAANPNMQFYATDFNPAHIANAKRLAADGNLANVHFFDDAFDEFAGNKVIPDKFDIISLHGIYSWISKENRDHIVQFIRDRLSPGGIVYISYNTLPGWASILPLRQLMISHANSKTGPISARIDAALEYAQGLVDIGADFFAKNAESAERIKKNQKMSRNYLAHEYFNKDLTPFYFEEIVDELSSSKLSYVSSAHVLDQIDVVNLSADQIRHVREEKDEIRQQMLRDFIVNQQFRRDIFAKGKERYDIGSSRETWLDTRFALTTWRDDVPETLKSRLGNVSLQSEVYKPILDKFAEGPATLRDILSNPVIADLGWIKLQQAIGILVGMGHLQPCLSAKNEKKRKDHAKSLNKAIMQRARYSADISYLASPVIGSGVSASRIELLFLNCLANGNKSIDYWVSEVWKILKEQGQKLLQDGKTIETEEGNIMELERQATEFSKKKLPILQTLQVL